MSLVVCLVFLCVLFMRYVCSCSVFCLCGVLWLLFVFYCIFLYATLIDGWLVCVCVLSILCCCSFCGLFVFGCWRSCAICKAVCVCVLCDARVLCLCIVGFV